MSRLGEHIPYPEAAPQQAALVRYTQFVWPPAGDVFDPERARAIAAINLDAAERMGSDPAMESADAIKRAELIDLAHYLMHLYPSGGERAQ